MQGGVAAPDWLPTNRVGDWGRGASGSKLNWPLIERIHIKPHTTQYHGVDGTIIDVPRIDPGPNEDKGDMIVEWQGDRENQAEEVCLDGEAQKLNYYVTTAPLKPWLVLKLLCVRGRRATH